MVRILDLEKYASENNVPIMMKDGIEFMENYIKDNNVKTILEIGTAIGYSAIRMALIDSDIKIVTIERDENRYQEAVKNVAKFNLEKQIEIYLDDALEFSIDQKFDMIFIDAAKAQYIKFFEKYKNNLNDGGLIITDNLKFHGLVNGNKENLSRNLRSLVSKIEKFIDFLKNNSEFKTEFIDIGDGIGISRKES